MQEKFPPLSKRSGRLFLSLKFLRRLVFLLFAVLPSIVMAQTHPEPTRVNGWQWSSPANVMNPSSGKRNNIFYVSDPIVFTLGSGGPAVSYEVRNYYGSLVASNTIPGGATSITIPVSQPGWYKLYLYGGTSNATFGDVVGGTMFVIFRNTPGFPANPAPGTSGGNGYDADEILRGVAGIGPQRHSVDDVNNPSGAYGKLDLDVSLDKQYYVPFDSVRNRRLMMAFPNGVTSTQTGNLTAIVNHFKADVKYWEPRNEPNFFTDGATFASGEMHTFYQTVKAADPTAKVLGPGTVSVGPVGGGLGWIQDFLTAGGGNYIDGFSFHIYNGVNGDVFMARKTLDGLNALLTSFGQQNKEKWQTEQGNFAAVYGAYEPSHQGRWTMVQKMVFEQYRIPKEQDNLWYDRSHGFWDFPTWIENDDGSLNPGAALMRVWAEELYGTTFSQAYDFGPSGNNIYIGSLFTGTGKSVAAFMSAGATDGQVTLNVSGGTSLNIVSAFGVASIIPVTGGQAVLPVRELPVYVEMASGQTVSVVPLNYGQNLARLSGVTASSSGSTANISKIFNGDLENWYYNQQGGTEPWDSGATTTFPCSVELDWPSSQTISRVIVYAAPLWQSMGSLLDYDLQYWNGSAWITLQTMTEPAQTFGVLTPTVHTTVDSFYNERWIFLHNFSPVTTSKIRLWVRAATYGGGATLKVQEAGGQTGYQRVMLREIEVYGTGGATAPSAPGSLAATAVSGTRINLSWTDGVNNEDGFKIERKTGAGGTYAQVGVVGANVTTFNDSGLSAATQYFYRVRAYNVGGNSAYSNEANATTTALSPPAAPSGLTANAISSARIDLTWTDNSSTETGFKIERKTGAGGTYAQIGTVGANVTSYSNTGLTQNTQYYYRVRANNADGDSSYSAEANATTPVLAAPAAPSGLIAMGSSSSQITLSWIDNASNEDGFTIERKTGAGGTYAQVVALGPNVSSYFDGSLAANTEYYYRVRAGNGGGNSAYAPEANAFARVGPAGYSWCANEGGSFTFSTTVDVAFGANGAYNYQSNVTGTITFDLGTFGDPIQGIAKAGYYRAIGVPAPPSTLAATALSGTQASLSWADNAGNETGFKIERKTGIGGTYVQIATVGANVTAYSDSGLTLSTQYYYRVRANNGSGDSAYSNEANVTTLSTIPASSPTFSPAAGTFTVAQSVAISSATSGASIRYTTDGSTPSSTAGTVYTSPVNISVTTTLKAIAYKSGMTDSTVTSGTYTINSATAPTPIVSLAFNENTGTAVANTGSVGGSLTRTTPTPAWSVNVPSGVGGASAIDFGTATGNFVVESAAAISQLGGLSKFTITGWLNCRNSTEGSGGNRIVSWINNGGDGVDLVYKSDGSLQISVDQWPDTSPARSSASKITTSASVPAGNWKFFAVSYDSTLASGQVKFYFGDNSLDAVLDVSKDYSGRGAVNTAIGRLAIGHFNSATRSTALDRMFRGLIDDIRIYGDVLPLTQIVQAQRQSGIISGAIYRLTPKLALTRSLDVYGVGTADGTQVQIWDFGAGNNQKWAITDVGGGYYKLIPQHATTKALDVDGALNADGTKIQIWTDNGTSAQKWQITDVGSGYYKLQPQCAPSSSLSLKDSASTNGTIVHLWTDLGVDAQRWKLEKQ